MLEQVLGKTFLRDDAASAQLTFDKLRAGRVDYAVLEQMTIAYRLRTERAPGMRTDLVFETFKAGCAFASRTRIPFKDIDRAVTALAGEGAVDAILARYR